MATKRKRKKARKNPSKKRHAAPKRKRARHANPSKKRHTKRARRSNPSPARRRKGKRRHKNPGIGKELIALAAGIGAGVVVTLASALIAPTSTTAAWGITGAGVAAGLGLALAVDPIIGGAVAVGAAAPMVVTKLATKLYQMFTAKPAAAAPAAAAPTTTNGLGNPFGMAAVGYGSRQQAAAALGLGAVSYGLTRQQAAQAAGMGNPFGMGGPNPYGMRGVF